jgi:hypothetical protein
MAEQEQENAMELAMLRRDLESMQADMAEVKADLKKLANAWAAAETLVAFVKWLAALGAAVMFLTGIFKGWFVPVSKE